MTPSDLLAGNPVFLAKALAEERVPQSMRPDDWNASWATLALHAAAEHNEELKSLAERMGGYGGILERAASGDLTEDERVILGWLEGDA